MNYFRKMILLPLDEYNKYRNLVYTTQVTPEINPLQRELEEIKNTYGTSLPDDEKVKLEGEIIQKYKDKAINKNIEIVPTNHEQMKESIKDFSKTNKTRAIQLYNHLSSKYNSHWNDDGELLGNDGLPISNTNILDLVNFVTTAQSISKAPKGFSDFITLLNKANTPKYMISKRGELNIDSELDKQIDVQSSNDEGSDLKRLFSSNKSELQFTPVSHKKRKRRHDKTNWIS